MSARTRCSDAISAWRLQVGDAGDARRVLELRLLRARARGGDAARAPRRRCASRPRAAVARVLEPRLRVGELRVELLEARLGGGPRLGLARRLGREMLELVGDLAVAAAALRLVLLQPLQRQLAAVQLARRGATAPRACAASAAVALRDRGVGADQRGARFVGEQRLRAGALLEVLDLVLPRQHAGLLGVGRMELQMVAADLMAGRRHERRAGGSCSRRASASASSSAT